MAIAIKARELKCFCEWKDIAIDIVVGGKTFQVSGMRGVTGYFERFFPAGDHPYRKNVFQNEIQSALDHAQWFRVYDTGNVRGQRWRGMRRDELYILFQSFLDGKYGMDRTRLF